MEEKKNKQEIMPQETILKALEEDKDAIQEVIQHYEKRIHDDLVYLAQKQGINLSYMPLADMEQEVRIHLVKALKKFKK